MPKKRLHRVSIYLLDPDRRRVLLCRSEQGPFASKYVALSAGLNDVETPLETLRTLVTRVTRLDFDFLGHATSMPTVLDEQSVKFFPPLHLQVTAIDQNTDIVEYVYVGQAKTAPTFREGSPLNWFTPATLRNAPTHVKAVVHHILSLMG
ncbi:hypothetical protein [Acanthopleuribacter pedis]|uniref:Nudix hydrolase domain-containing protein n=1 Tax=Acanthopleuribacter pedis TaxID=442870 RepID=A0A8J7QA30_9BACT|nr:hypothetical protein [Acanthopleuribacter pedis]MBO1319804.1 hypothetical protein [Acanthopleuribacter pedis]